MKTKTFLTTVLAFACITVFSQTTEPKKEEKKEDNKAVKFDLAGQISFAKDAGSNVYLTFGGPGIKFSLGKKVALNVGMYPSLKYNYEFNEKVDKTGLNPILGTGAQLSYSHVSVGCMFYLLRNLWYAAPSIGYKFK